MTDQSLRQGHCEEPSGDEWPASRECLDDTDQRPDDTPAEMASDVMSKFEYPTSLRSICVTVIII